jgi:hypothetical protein
MKLNYFITDNGYISNSHVHDGCAAFFDKFGVVPKVLYLPYNAYSHLMASNPQAGLTYQEVDKDYKQVIPIVGGFLELKLMPKEESVHIASNTALTISHTMPLLVIFENNEIDEQFEKQVLGNNG